ncbi:ABC transporter permease [Massilia sp. W12]|uniref:MlaE family ABC transporter permease n=1 Tax=Massilia sp. W12 TaxID=3126507 RepID=UPI0030CAAADD
MMRASQLKQAGWQLEGGCLRLHGHWQVECLARGKQWQDLQTRLTQQAARVQEWDLRGIVEFDHIGAQLLWQVWGRQRPPRLLLGEGQEAIFEHLQQAAALQLPPQTKTDDGFVYKLGARVLGFFQHVLGFIAMAGQFSLDLLRFLRAPWRGPWKEISANVYRAGFQALGITALVGILIGIVLSYLSAQQLRNFGADTFIVNMLGIAIIRELGPMLAAILVAGRSGSSIAAQLGVMRVTEELDAMLVMGIPHGFRLILPKVLALMIAMPLLVIWTDMAALGGGMLAAYLELNMSPEFFLQKLRESVPLLNYWLGLAKGVVFGFLIGLTACHFGMRILPNTDSLGRGATSSVVTSITIVIFADAIFAVAFRGLGIIF